MQNSKITTETQVLIIGGSLVGLSAALFLAWRGVDVLVIEKHSTNSKHPRAIGFTELTLEHYRAVKISDQIPQAPANIRLRRVKAESLTGIWYQETLWTPDQVENDKGIASPMTGAAIAQDLLEPILRKNAQKYGANLRYNTEMLCFEQQHKDVIVQVHNHQTNVKEQIKAQYVIACDGAHSKTREILAITREGIGVLKTIRSVLFNCPEAEIYLNQGIQQFEIEKDDFKAFLTHYPDGRWVLMFHDDRNRTEEQLKNMIIRALGREMPIEIITTGRWEMAGLIASQYSKGRVFLAGDAAHQLPPTRGGFGANTGIDDVYNLAWKLSMVLNAEAAPALLETYNAERQPIGWLRHQQTFSRPDYNQWLGKPSFEKPTLYDAEAMELGQRVESTAVIQYKSENLPPAAHPEKWAGEPGTRVPHVWIQNYNQKISTIDLFTENFALISDDPSWIEAAKQVSFQFNIPIDSILVNQDVFFQKEKSFYQTFTVQLGDAVLVRPDAIVACKLDGVKDSSIQAQTLSNYLLRILGRDKNN